MNTRGFATLTDICPPEIRERCHSAPDLSQQFDDHKYLQEGV